MVPKSYKNAPIVEAIVELRFAPGSSWAWGATSLPVLAERFAPLYPGPVQRRNTVQLKFDGEKPPTSLLQPQRLILPTMDRKALVGLGENHLSVHVLAPYPGWDAFLARVIDALNVYREVANPEGISLVGVRYLDEITVPGDDINLMEYFQCLPPRVDAMPSTLNAFQIVTHAHDETENFTAVLALASKATSEGSGLTMLYDLNLVRPFEAAAPFASVEEHARFLHDRQRLIFEDSITDKTRSLFQ